MSAAFDRTLSIALEEGGDALIKAFDSELARITEFYLKKVRQLGCWKFSFVSHALCCRTCPTFLKILLGPFRWHG
jgi:hypothetical protein